MFATTRLMSNADSTVFDHFCMGIVYLNDGDYVECFCATGANTTATYASGLYYKPPNLSMHRLGK